MAVSVLSLIKHNFLGFLSKRWQIFMAHLSSIWEILFSHNYCHFLVCPYIRRFSIWIGKWVILLVVIGPQVSSSATWSDRFEIACATVISLWATAAVLASFAYPTPEQPTPSFGDHTCFNGVAFGIVSFQHNCWDIMSCDYFSISPVQIFRNSWLLLLVLEFLVL